MTLTILVDPTHTFADQRPHLRCRSRADALESLRLVRFVHGGEVWLSCHPGNLAGVESAARTVVEEIARAAFDREPYPLTRVFLADAVSEQAGTAGADDLTALRELEWTLRSWGCPVVRVPAQLHLSPDPVDDIERTEPGTAVPLRQDDQTPVTPPSPGPPPAADVPEPQGWRPLLWPDLAAGRGVVVG